MKKPIFLSGPAGSGKSLLIETFLSVLKPSDFLTTTLEQASQTKFNELGKFKIIVVEEAYDLGKVRDLVAFAIVADVKAQFIFCSQIEVTGRTEELPYSTIIQLK